MESGIQKLLERSDEHTVAGEPTRGIRMSEATLKSHEGDTRGTHPDRRA